jgi:phage gp29-like protein
MPEPVTKNKMVYSEVGVAGSDILFKYGISQTENPDTLISKKGLSYIETKVERDTHFTQCLATRRHKLLKKGWRLKPASVTRFDQNIADFVNYNIEAMGGSFEKDIEGMLSKVQNGFSLTEKNYIPIKYGIYQGKVGLKNLRLKPAKYFSFKFDKYGYWDIIQVDTKDYKPITLPKDKFIHIINGANDENPYGDCYGAKAAFWVWLKENEAKFWAIFSERFGMPITDITTPRKMDAVDKAKVSEIMEAVQRDTGISHPEGFTVGFLEATRSGDAAYNSFLERCNKEISKIILGQTLSNEEGSRGQGSYALGQTHAETMDDYIAFDAVDIAVAINEQLIKPLVDINFITKRYPTFEFLGIDLGALISMSQSIQNLVNSGLKIPVKWAYQSSGIPVPKEDEEILKPVPVNNSYPATPGAKPDNRTKMLEDTEPAEVPAQFKEENEEFEKILNKYKTDSTSLFNGFKNWWKNTVKKKA